MMYSFDLTVPVNTPVATPVTQVAVVTHGIVNRVEVQFPTGCAGLVGAQVWTRLHQLYPGNDGAWFVTDGIVIGWSEEYEMTSTPFEFILRGYNLDDTYPHTITFRFAIVNVADTLASKIGRLFGTRNVPQAGD